MLIVSKLTLFSCQNSSKSFHAARASCTNMRDLPTGSIRFHFIQGRCGSHKLIEVMLTKKKKLRQDRKCQAERGHSKVDWNVMIRGAVFFVTWNEIELHSYLSFDLTLASLAKRIQCLMRICCICQPVDFAETGLQSTLFWVKQHRRVFKYYFYLQVNQIRSITTVGRQGLPPQGIFFY